MDETLRGECFNWFCEHPTTTARDVADHFGVPFDTIREWAKVDQWNTRRTLSRYSDISNDISEQALLLRAVVVERATEGDATATELCKLVEAFNSLAKFEPKDDGIPRELLDNM